MSGTVRTVVVEGPHVAPPRPRGPFTYVSTPRAVYNNIRMMKDPYGDGGATTGRGCRAHVPPPPAHRRHAATDTHRKRSPPPAADEEGGGEGEHVDSRAARAKRTRRLALARRVAAARLRARTPPPAPGRRHHPIQTNRYLEELVDAPQEAEAGCQTDAFEDRPATPLYVPAKTGADAGTQIAPGDLFDFDLEAGPIVEVLVGKTTEQALGEVAAEEELAALREQRRRYTELRDAERAERRRLAYQDQRLWEEKERRVAEARLAQEAAVEARDRCAAATLVRGYVAELLPSVIAGLRDQGFLVERVRRGVDEEFMPWLTEQVSQEIESLITSRDLIDEIVREVVAARHEAYRRVGAAGPPPPPPESATPDTAGEELDEEEDDDM